MERLENNISIDSDFLVSPVMDKDTWIYTHGSDRLQQARSFGYECEERYQQERLKADYSGFKINEYSLARKLDFPPYYAIKESLKWKNAYVAKQSIYGEVIVIDDFLGKHQLIKKTWKPWYLFYKNLLENDVFIKTALSCSLGLIAWIIIVVIIESIR